MSTALLLKQIKEREEQREREIQQAKENSNKKEEAVIASTASGIATPTPSMDVPHVPADDEEPPVPEVENEETVAVSFCLVFSSLVNI